MLQKQRRIQRGNGRIWLSCLDKDHGWHYGLQLTTRRILSQAQVPRSILVILNLYNWVKKKTSWNNSTLKPSKTIVYFPKKTCPVHIGYRLRCVFYYFWNCSRDGRSRLFGNQDVQNRPRTWLNLVCRLKDITLFVEGSIQHPWRSDTEEQQKHLSGYLVQSLRSWCREYHIVVGVALNYKPEPSPLRQWYFSIVQPFSGFSFSLAFGWSTSC